MKYTTKQKDGTYRTIDTDNDGLFSLLWEFALDGKIFSKKKKKQKKQKVIRVRKSFNWMIPFYMFLFFLFFLILGLLQ